MRTIALYALVALLPTAIGYAIIAAVRGGRRLSGARHGRPLPPESLDRLTAQLRRLRAELEAMEAVPRATAKNYRLRVLRGAYLDAMAMACERLEVSPPPNGDRARQADIYRTEAALRERGLDVRETAAS